jgi:hypothetical protein
LGAALHRAQHKRDLLDQTAAGLIQRLGLFMPPAVGFIGAAESCIATDTPALSLHQEDTVRIRTYRAPGVSHSASYARSSIFWFEFDHRFRLIWEYCRDKAATRHVMRQGRCLHLSAFKRRSCDSENRLNAGLSDGVVRFAE